ncbi:CBS domain-containing protein [Haliangium ochraceum]|nr:CBS domain-containing protein [Haliangium ochraceum]
MTEKVITVSPEAQVQHAVWSLSAKGISGAPVQDAEGRVVGVLSRSDLVDTEAHQLVAGDTPVSEAMTAHIWSVHPDAPASDAVLLMVEKEIHRLMVMDEERSLVGVITSMDIMKALVAGHDLRPPGRESMPLPRVSAVQGDS